MQEPRALGSSDMHAHAKVKRRMQWRCTARQLPAEPHSARMTASLAFFSLAVRRPNDEPAARRRRSYRRPTRSR